MRRLLMIATVVAAFTACKKEAKPTGSEPATTPAAGSADTTGSAAKPAEPPPAMTDTKPPEAPPTMPGATTTPPSMSMGGGKPVARPPSVTDAMVAVADAFVVAMEEMGASVAAAGTDCKKAAAAIRASGEKMKPIAEAAEKLKDQTDKDESAKDWFQATYMPRMMKGMGPMMQTAQACSQDKDFMAAAESLQMPGQKKAAHP